MRTPRRHRDLAQLPSELRAALTADASEEELAGEQQALQTYRAVSWERRRRFRPAIWRPAVLSTIIATKLGAAVAAGAVGLGGTAAAAYTGNLPNGLQDFAHKTIKAPKAHGVGPDAKGPAAHGLCQAFVKDKDDEAKEQRKAQERAKERAAEQARERAAGETPKAVPPGQAKKQDRGAKEKGTPPGLAGKDGSKGKHSVAYRNLVQAAGGENDLEAYCAKVRKDKDAQRAAEASSSPKAKPSKAPKPTASRAPSKAASPTASATGSPSPSPDPTGTPEPSPTG